MKEFIEIVIVFFLGMAVGSNANWPFPQNSANSESPVSSLNEIEQAEENQ